MQNPIIELSLTIKQTLALIIFICILMFIGSAFRVGFHHRPYSSPVLTGSFFKTDQISTIIYLLGIKTNSSSPVSIVK